MAEQKNSLEQYSDDALKGRIAVFRGLLIVMGIVVLGYLAFYIYLMASGKFDSGKHLLGLVPCFGMMLAGTPSLLMMRKYQAELASRKASQDG